MIRIPESTISFPRNQRSRWAGIRIERQPQGEASYLCKVSHANGKPILFLPNRDQNPGLPSGPTPVQIDGTRYEADFVKVAPQRRPPTRRG